MGWQDALGGIIETLPVLAAGFTKNPNTVTQTALMGRLGGQADEDRRRKAFAREVFALAKTGEPVDENAVFALAEKYGIPDESAFRFIQNFQQSDMMKRTRPVMEKRLAEEEAQLDHQAGQRETRGDLIGRLKDLMGHEAGQLVGPPQATNLPEWQMDVLGSDLDNKPEFIESQLGKPENQEPDYFTKKNYEAQLARERFLFEQANRKSDPKDPKTKVITRINPKTGEKEEHIVPDTLGAVYPTGERYVDPVYKEVSNKIAQLFGYTDITGVDPSMAPKINSAVNRAMDLKGEGTPIWTAISQAFKEINDAGENEKATNTLPQGGGMSIGLPGDDEEVIGVIQDLYKRGTPLSQIVDELKKREWTEDQIAELINKAGIQEEEGPTAVNPKTGERVKLVNGKWVPIS